MRRARLYKRRHPQKQGQHARFGPRRRVVGVFVDGDDDKALRAAAQHSARMEALGSLTAGVAHDFNNLLTVLVGNLYLIGEEVRELPRVFEKLKAARDAGKRGTELIKQLMTFARREEISVGTLDPSKVVAGVLPDNCLLITITVTAWSAVLCAANAETASGFGPVAATLVSPNVDLLPS